MIDSHLLEQGGVQIVDVHGILEDVVTVIIGLSMLVTRLKAAASYPSRKAATVMVSAVVVFCEFAL